MKEGVSCKSRTLGISSKQIFINLHEMLLLWSLAQYFVESSVVILALVFSPLFFPLARLATETTVIA